MEKPTQPKEQTFTDIKRICQEYMDFIDNDEEYIEDNDFKQFIFEEAMECVFGRGVFDYINERHK